MKTKTVAATALIALLLAVVATAAVASTGHPDPQARGNDNKGNGDDHGHMAMACDNLTTGQTLAVSGLTGHYANATNHEMHGNATGAFTLKVTGVYAEGCALSIVGGNFKLNATTYTVSGGSIVLNHGGRSGEGTGTTPSGSFLIWIAGLHGNSTSANVGAVRLDFKTGTSQFLVNLHSAQSPSPGDRDDDGD